MKIVFSLLVFVATSSAAAESTFMDYVGKYSVDTIVQISGIDCNKSPSPENCISRQSEITIRSDNDTANIKITNPNQMMISMSMTEFSLEGEGRHSKALFEIRDGGAYWEWNSNYGWRYASIKLISGAHYLLKIRPRENPMDNREIALIIVRH